MTRRRTAVLPVGFVLLVIAVGSVATWGRYGPSNIPNGVPPLVAGWVIAGSGLVAWVQAPWSRVGHLLALAGCTIFLTDFSSCLSIVPISPRCFSTGMFGTLAGQLAFLWTGFVAHALIAYPTGRPVIRRDRAAILVAYVIAVLPMLWRADAGPLVLPGLLAAVLVTDWISADRRVRAERKPGVLAAIGVALAMAVISLIGVASSVASTVDLTSALELMTAVASVGITVRFVGRSHDPSTMADLVIGLSESGRGAVGDALALAMGDRTLQVGFLSDVDGTFVDGAGRPIELPAVDSTDRSVLTIQRDDRLVAVLMHDPAVDSDPALHAALAAAADLTATNAGLQAEARAQLHEVLSSRRRLLDAAVDERRELEQRLHDGPERHLDLLANELSDARAGVVDDASIASRLDRAIEQLVATRTEVRELARGLHPRALEERGLRGALTELAERSPVPVELLVDLDVDPDLSLQATIYFVASEALANVAKYAPASSVRIALHGSAAATRLIVADDGPGGANPAVGSGLRGLADRVEALGGSFDIASRPGHGTRLAATIPSGGEAP